jgi:transitional endoplasmic reticulum ATPase
MNLDSVENDIMIMDEDVDYALSPLTARIEQPEKCIARNIPIKFGVLIEGAYGTGKTLYAFKLGNKAIKLGWSFIYLKSPELLADTLRMAKTLDKNGHGIIVFVEDIDQVVRGDRNAAMQDILNTLDGGDTKDMNVISLFTTNHLELIEPTFLRGKRIGTIISMPMLSAKTAEKYVAAFCKGIELKGDFAPVYELIEKSDIAPAFMAEIIENVKSNMIIRDENTIEASHVINCVKSYLRQVGLSKTKDTSLTREAAFVNLLRDNIHDEAFYVKVAEISKDMAKEALDEQ